MEMVILTSRCVRLKSIYMQNLFSLSISLQSATNSGLFLNFCKISTFCSSIKCNLKKDIRRVMLETINRLRTVHVLRRQKTNCIFLQTFIFLDRKAKSRVWEGSNDHSEAHQLWSETLTFQYQGGWERERKRDFPKDPKPSVSIFKIMFFKEKYVEGAIKISNFYKTDESLKKGGHDTSKWWAHSWVVNETDYRSKRNRFETQNIWPHGKSH